MASAPDLDMKGVTQEEVSKLTRAMKTKEFQGHMDEYCREISDPHNRKEYLQYLDQLEAKGEMPDGQQLLRCQPGLCVKTQIYFRNGQTQKCFINIVHSDRIEDVTMERSDKGDGHSVRLPYSLGPPRPDRDLKDQYCMTCDFAVSTRTYLQAVQRPNYLKMLVDTAADGLTSHHLKGNEEVRKDYKVLQRMRCKGGAPMPMSVKAELLKDKGAKPTTPKLSSSAADSVTPSELRQMRREAKQGRSDSQQRSSSDVEEVAAQQKQQAEVPAAVPAPRIRVPQHKLVHSGTIELADYMEAPTAAAATVKLSVPKLLKLTVDVPTVKRVGDISLEVTSNNVVVEVPDKYYLDLPLPFEVQETQGAAKFDKVKQVLSIELPVVPRPQVPNPNIVATSWEGNTGNDDGALLSDEEEELPVLQLDAVAQEPTCRDVLAPEPTAGLCCAADHAAGPAVGPEVPAPAAAEVAAPTPQLLELEPRGALAQIASEGVRGDEALREEEELLHDHPPFIAAAAFEGARAGYYYSLGDQGLGYYLDLRQRAPRGRGQRGPSGGETVAIAASSADPLVEVHSSREAEGIAPEPTVAASTSRQLPAAAQRFVTATAALALQVSDVSEFCEEPRAEWVQNLQNLMLFIEVPTSHEDLASLRLALQGQRLSVSFCARARAAEAAPWRRFRLCRLLCGMVDGRQWHAEPPVRPGGRLVVVVRKLDRGLWPRIFEAGAVLEAFEEEERLLEEQPQDIVRDTREAPAEDSAQLDASTIEEERQADLEVPIAATAAAGARGHASEAMIQSAMVMGQGVLLRNRLVYQLL